MAIRGIRGAITAADNNEESILSATRELLSELQRLNGFQPDELATAWFTATADLDAVFPAKAARQMGWTEVPLMDAQEMAVPAGLALCIRVLLLWNTELPQKMMRCAYLKGARVLRPDLAPVMEEKE